MARPGLFRHRKFSRLARALRSHILAVGVLETLWYVCGETCDDRVGAAEDVAFALKWDDKRIDIACVLHESGFLDCDDAGSYTVHDFWDHCPQYIKRRREREDSRRADGSATKARLASGRTMASQRLVNGLPVASTPVSEQSSAEQSSAGEAREALPRDPVTGYVVGHARVGVGRSGGSMPGRSPHAAYQCEAFTVPVFLHQKFLGRLQNANDPAPEDTLQAWYRTLRDRMAGQETPAQEVQWLSAEFDAWRKPKAVVKPTADDDGAARLAAWAAQGAAS